MQDEPGTYRVTTSSRFFFFASSARQKKFEKRLVRERVLTRDQLAILKHVALPWSEHTHIAACGLQGEVRIKRPSPSISSGSRCCSSAVEKIVILYPA